MRIKLFFITVVFGLLLWNCGQSDKQDNSTAVMQPLDPISFQQMWEKQRDSARLIDVRTSKEFENGHIPDANMIDFLESDFKQQISNLDRNDPVLVYCRSGNRSDKAAEQMKQMGFDTIYTLTGGIKAWEKENLPVE